MKPLSELPSREPGACGGGAGSRSREGVCSSGGWELVAPSGRPPPRIPAPEPHHGARKGELLFGEGEGCPGGSASLRRGKAGGESLRKFSGRPWTGAGGGEGSGDALRGGIPRPGPDLPLFPHRQKTETAKTGSGGLDGGSGLPRTPGGKRGASASTTDSSTLKDPEEPIFGPIPCLPAPQAAVTWPPPPQRRHPPPQNRERSRAASSPPRRPGPGPGAWPPGPAGGRLGPGSGHVGLPAGGPAAQPQPGLRGAASGRPAPPAARGGRAGSPSLSCGGRAADRGRNAPRGRPRHPPGPTQLPTAPRITGAPPFPPPEAFRRRDLARAGRGRAEPSTARRGDPFPPVPRWGGPGGALTVRRR